MPLIKSATNAARQENIREMIHSGHPVKQAVAASYHNQREVAAHERESHEHAKYGRHRPY